MSTRINTKNRSLEKALEKWVMDHNNNQTKTKYYVVIGKKGIGKWTFIRTCLQKVGCLYSLFNQDDMNLSEFDNLLNKITYFDIIALLNESRRKSIVIIRNFHIFTKDQRRQFFHLFKDKSVRQLSPVLVILNDEKELAGLKTSMEKTNGKIVYYREWTNTQFIELGLDMARTNEKRVSRNLITKIAKDVDHDINSFCNTLGILLKGRRTQYKIDEKYEKKDDAHFPKRTVYKIIKDPMHTFDLVSHYSTKCIQRNYLRFKNIRLEDAAYISDTLSSSNYYLNKIHNSHYWDMYYEHNIISSILPSTRLCKLQFPEKFNYNQNPKGTIKFMYKNHDYYYAIFHILLSKPVDEIRAELNRLRPSFLTRKQYLRNSLRFCNVQDKYKIKKINKIYKSV